MVRLAGRQNTEWETPEGESLNWDHIAIEVLMDIRSELRELNSTLGCFRMQRMCDDIHKIDQRLLKKGYRLR